VGSKNFDKPEKCLLYNLISIAGKWGDFLFVLNAVTTFFAFRIEEPPQKILRLASTEYEEPHKKGGILKSRVSFSP
jgi:hypothetical protein